MRLDPLVVALLALPLAASAEEGVKVKERAVEFHPAPYFLAAMEASSRVYEIRLASDLGPSRRDAIADLLWPRAKEPYKPKVRSEPGGRYDVGPWPFPPEASEDWKRAERLYGEKEYEEALDLYREIAKSWPEHYLAVANVGDSQFFLRRYPEALEAYEEALALNPHDAALHLYRGHALVRLGRPEEARAAFVHGLTLSPGRSSLLSLLRKYADGLGVVVEEEPFEPKAFVEEAGDKLAVYVPERGTVPWFAWAACKAVWLGEPDHRREMTGSTNHIWTSVEEVECLRVLVDAYVRTLDEPDGERFAALDRIRRIADDGLLEAFVLYEIGSRVFPHVTLVVPDGLKGRLTTYVERYVSPRR